MTQRELVGMIAAIVATLRDTGKGSPESILYMGIGMDLSKWEIVRDALISMELCQIQGHFVTLSPKGQEIGERLLAKGF